MVTSVENDANSSLRQRFDPRIELYRISAPLDQILHLTGSLPCLYYTLDVEKSIVELGDDLKFVRVKRSFYSVSGQIFQLVSHRSRRHSSGNDENLEGQKLFGIGRYDLETWYDREMVVETVFVSEWMETIRTDVGLSFVFCPAKYETRKTFD